MEFKIADTKVLSIGDIFSDFFKTNSVSKDDVGYGVKMIHAEKVWKETKGEGINVAVLDTGIDFNHPDLKNRVKGGINFTTSDPEDYMDRQGHGTHCAGVIGAALDNKGVVGVAPECNLYAVKVLGDKGNGNLNWILMALDWCIKNKMHVVSMSLGTQILNLDLHKAIKKAHAAGLILVAAAGNDGDGGLTSTIDYPAAFKEVIAVGAIDENQQVGGFSSTGVNVRLAAAGVDIVSTYPGGKYAKLSGTSMACPHISGAIALMLARGLIRFNRILSYDEILLLIEMMAEDLGKKGRDDKYGFGMFSF